MDGFYNPLWRHSALDYSTPNEHEALHSKKAQLHSHKKRSTEQGQAHFDSPNGIRIRVSTLRGLSPDFDTSRSAALLVAVTERRATNVPRTHPFSKPSQAVMPGREG